jgi:aminoglycoside 3-N-acetyltransferase
MTEAQTLSLQITSDLLALGVQPGGVLLVHSSLRSLGLPAGLPDRAGVAIRGLLAALGEAGTLLMPALSYETVGADQPRFDVLRTPSCVGALPEAFRVRPGTLRSVHPTHSVCAAGPRAAELLGDHAQDTTPVGPRSPFARLPECGGQILFLGCGLRPNTSMHGVEERVDPPYLYAEPVDYQITLADGSETSMTVRSHGFRGWEQRYDRLEGLMEKGITRGRVLAAECYLLDARAAWDAALAALRKDPLALVEGGFGIGD